MPTGEPAGSFLNVGLFGAAIKGKGSPRRPSSSFLLLEQFIGRIAMACGVGEMLFHPGYFARQGINTFIKLIDRKGAEVLLDEQGQGVLRLAGKELILVHAVQS